MPQTYRTNGMVAMVGSVRAAGPEQKLSGTLAYVKSTQLPSTMNVKDLNERLFEGANILIKEDVSFFFKAYSTHDL